MNTRKGIQTEIKLKSAQVRKLEAEIEDLKQKLREAFNVGDIVEIRSKQGEYEYFGKVLCVRGTYIDVSCPNGTGYFTFEHNHITRVDYLCQDES
jgi:dihydroorotate dehydrogenase